MNDQKQRIEKERKRARQRQGKRKKKTTQIKGITSLKCRQLVGRARILTVIIELMDTSRVWRRLACMRREQMFIQKDKEITVK